MVIMVGIPGSGKSTLAKQLEDSGYLRLSSDSIREELYGDEAVQGDPNRVFSVFNQRLRKAMSESLPIVVDNTNVVRSYRKRLIKQARENNYEVELWVMNTKLLTCLARNRKRTRVVPTDVVVNFYTRFKRQYPNSDEAKIVLFGND